MHYNGHRESTYVLYNRLKERCQPPIRSLPNTKAAHADY